MHTLVFGFRLNGLTDELGNLKKNVDDLRQENDWLQQEAQKVRTESVCALFFYSEKQLLYMQALYSQVM